MGCALGQTGARLRLGRNGLQERKFCLEGKKLIVIYWWSQLFSCLYEEALNILYLKEVTQSTFYLIEIPLNKHLVVPTMYLKLCWALRIRPLALGG